MYQKYKDESKIYFSKEGMGYMGDVWEQTSSRGDIRRHRGMHDYIIAKYSDKNGSGFSKPNTTGPANKYRDSLRRLGPCYQKLSVNYAAPLCDKNDYARLLGPGFEF
tara:strand:+ start:120 stop:440 length:321 start_codon:yes stop_codon:yes gene_type:complete